MPSPLRKLGKNEYIYSVITKIAMILIGILFSVVQARYLGAELKGSVTYINGIASVGSIILTFGIHQAYPYYRNKYGKEQYLPIYMTLVIVLFSLQIAICIAAACFLPISNEWKASLILMPLIGYATIVGYVYLVENPNGRNTALTWVSVIEFIYIVFLFFLTDPNLVLAISVLMLAELLKTVYFTYKIPFRFTKKAAHRSHIWELLSYGFFPMLALLMTTLNYKVDVIMLGNSVHVTLAQVGIYSIGYLLADKCLLVSDAVKQILLSKLANGKGPAEVAMAMRLCFPIAIFLALGVMLFGQIVIDFLYGDEFTGAYSITLICVLGTIPMVFFKMITQYNIVHKKQKLNVYFLSISVAINVVLNLLLIPAYNIHGAAVATVVSNIICAIIYIIYFSRISGIRCRELIFMQKEDIKNIRGFFKK